MMHLPAVAIPACGFIPWASSKLTDIRTLAITAVVVVALLGLVIGFFRGMTKGQPLVALFSAGAVAAIAIWLVAGGGAIWGAKQAVGETGSTSTSALVQSATSPAANTDGAC
jgi:hypothetical protein